MSQVSAPAATPRQVFSSPKWNGDHNDIVVTNNGNDPITVQAWVNTPDNSVTITVPSGTSVNVSTVSVLTQPNQLVNVGYNAYDNGVKVDSYQATVRIVTTPTPLPTTSRSPGFTGLIGMTCVLGAALIMAKKMTKKK